MVRLTSLFSAALFPAALFPAALISAAMFSAVMLAGSRVCAEEGASIIRFHGYPGCILLKNDTTRVVISPVAGGRVLEYSLIGKQALFLEERATGRDFQPGKRASMSAGRFDIGPEKVIPRHPKLWSGDWKGGITGPRTALILSPKDEATGVQLTREFKLDEFGSGLDCKQTIRNISDEETRWCHWSRTFALGRGICLIPTSPFSRFPNHYVMYEGGDKINIRPEDDNIRLRDGFLEILAAPQEPKLGMDSQVGWFSYLLRNDLMFVKSFPVYPKRVYNEAAGLTISIWYPSDKLVVELEPIGPEERLRPGQQASFTERWNLAKFPFPKPGENADLEKVKELVKRLRVKPDGDR